MSTLHRIKISLLVIILCISCYPRRSSLGTIEINGEHPIHYEGLLPIGLTLDVGSGGRDLLDPNLLINGSFDLAPKLENCVYNPKTQEITTPNGYTTFYPLVSTHYGWEALKGSLQIDYKAPVSTSSRSYLLFYTTDTLGQASIINKKSRLSVKKGDQLTFSCDVKPYYGQYAKVGELTVMIVDSLYQEISNKVSITVSQQWQQQSGVLEISEPCNEGYLMIQTTIPTAIDNCKLVNKLTSYKCDIDTMLYHLIEELSPSFIKFPAGKTSNGYFVGTYPTWSNELDTITGVPLWTLSQNEYTGHFGLKSLTKLCDSLRTAPIIVANIGLTDPSAHPRSENIVELKGRIDKFKSIAHYMSEHGNDSISPSIEAGYNMDSQDYIRRFRSLVKSFQSDSINCHLISAANLTENHQLSDQKYDIPTEAIRTPNLSELLPNIHDLQDIMRQPKMIGEAHFELSDSNYYLPDITLRGAFMIDLERHSDLIKGVAICPTLGSIDSPSQLPLIYTDGIRYEPTILYHFLQAFTHYRGEVVRKVTEPDRHESDGSIRPLYLSLTSDKRGENYYLKAVNTTRHPMNYRILLTGMKDRFNTTDIMHFRIKKISAPTDTRETNSYEYKISHETQELKNNKELKYTFEPYEIVFFHFSKSTL